GCAGRRTGLPRRSGAGGVEPARAATGSIAARLSGEADRPLGERIRRDAGQSSRGRRYGRGRPPFQLRRMARQSRLQPAQTMLSPEHASDRRCRRGGRSRTARRLRFYARQFVDLASPANFVATNPDVAKLAVETQGESLRTGLANLIADLDKGGVSITDETAFEVGRNVAVSKGAVVFENELFQLIQYAPLTETVASRPLVIVPPCINKFYILDLQPENSFVRFAVEAGLTVFVVSWRNPDASCDDLTWEDYVAIGAMKAIDLALVISQADKVNAIGWCVGGTILSCALAILRVHGDDRIASVTLLTTLLDYEDPGDLGVFVDEQGVVQREQTIGQIGRASCR